MTARLIPCPHCDTLNRVPAQRLAEAGKCGKCSKSLFEARPLVLSTKRFDVHASAADLPLLVDFWAPWCGPCRMMAPTFEAMAREFEPRVRFAKVNTDEEKRLAARFAVRAIPTLALLRGSKEVARRSGALPAGEMRRWLTDQLALV